MGSQSDWPTLRNAAEILERARRAARDAHRLGASHARPDVRLCRGGGGARPARDHRRRRRRRASAGHDRGQDAPAGARRAGPERRALGARFAPVDRADAEGRAGRHAGDRRRRARRTRPCSPRRCWPRPTPTSPPGSTPGARPRAPRSPTSRRMAERIGPGGCIGILGGGQLGRMLALAAARLGLRCHVFEPAPGACAAPVVERVVRAPYDDTAALRAFAAAVDVVTYEFENVDLAAIDALAPLVPVRPGRRALEVAQDRLVEKRSSPDWASPRHPMRRWTTRRGWGRARPHRGARDPQGPALRLRRQGPGPDHRRRRRRGGAGGGRAGARAPRGPCRLRARDLGDRGARARRRHRGLRSRRERAPRRHPAHDDRPGRDPALARAGRGADRRPHPRRARLRRRDRGRDVRHARRAHRQRIRTARAQFRALDAGRLPRRSVRDACARDLRLAARRRRAPFRRRDDQSHRRRQRGRAGHHRRGGASLRQGGGAAGRKMGHVTRIMPRR
jgi:hypothetical protein